MMTLYHQGTLPFKMSAQLVCVWKVNQHAQGMVVKSYKSNLVIQNLMMKKCDVAVYKSAKCLMYRKKENIVAKLLVSKRQSFTIVSVHRK